MYVKVVDKILDAQDIVEKAKTDDSGCVAAYVGLIRDNSHGKSVISVEYRDDDRTAESKLRKLAEEIKQKFGVNGLAMYHRIGKLNVGDVNIVFAFACGHRQEAFGACSYAVDKFKEMLPTSKIETYADGSVNTEWD